LTRFFYYDSVRGLETNDPEHFFKSWKELSVANLDSIPYTILKEEIELGFPENWDITECRMAGHDKPSLSDDEMRSALQSTIGTPRLSEMAKGVKKVCILFDDIPKPTPTSRIMPFVLEELHAGGVTDEQIRFLCAPGSHRPLIYPEMVAKLGREIVEKYPVYNHSVWENLVDVGKTSRGTPVHVNREFASCDLRLGVGSIFPHPRAGFGGGGKLVLPGVCGIETIEHHHKNMGENAEPGRLEGNVFRLDIEEAARLAGLHFKVDVVINNRREVVGLFAGDLVAEHRAASKLGAQVYRTETIKDADVVVANSYPDEVQLLRTMWCIGPSLREGGDMVIVSHAPNGQNLHQAAGRFGTDYGGRMYNPGRLPKMQEKAARVIVVAPYLSRYEKDNAGVPEKVVRCRDWAEALEELKGRNGSDTKVGVYPYAPLQMTEKAARWLA
jgi:nickel-dependent lactate racemase